MIPRLEIKHLTVLVTLSQTGSITVTGNRLALTQSAVSHRLREAERRLSVKLVEPYQRGVRLTAEGERIRVFAERFLQDMTRLEQDIENTRKDAQTLVQLGQATYSRYHWLPAFFDYVGQIEPGLRVDVSGAATTRPFAALNHGSVDVATIYGREIAPGRYCWRKLATDPLVAVIAPGHRLAKLEYLDSTDIATERYFGYPLSAEPGLEWEALIGAPRIPFRQVTQMPTPEAVIDLVRAGLGISVFSRWAIEPEVADGTLITKPLSSEGMSLDWWAVTRAGDETADTPASLLAQALVSWSRHRSSVFSTLAFER